MKFERSLAEVQQVPGLTVAQEFRAMDYAMGYSKEQKRQEAVEAANIATKAVVLGKLAVEEAQQEMKAQQAVVVAPVVQEDRFKCTTIWNYQYNRNEVLMLGDLIKLEIEEFLDDPDAEYVAKVTGSVVLHRVADSSYYPNSVYAVIHQGEGTTSQQYASRTINGIGHTHTPDYVYEWAEDILRDGPIGPANLVFQDNKAHGTVWMQYKGMYYCTSNNL